MQHLGTKFPRQHIQAAVSHFVESVDAFQRESWEGSVTKAGKFLEAVLKGLCDHVGQAVPRGRLFKVEKVIQVLEHTPQGSYDDSIRLQIPRACRFGYDIASNRGARHDPDEVNPNQMDATVLVNLCSWILAEMVRLSQKGSTTPDRAREIVVGLITPRYPLIEHVDGRVYFHRAQKSARDTALVLLNARYPGRLHREELLDGILRHGFSENAGRVALTRLKGMVDDDGSGNLRLLAPSRRRAERLLTAVDGFEGHNGS